jgi:hypothetical protein
LTLFGLGLYCKQLYGTSPYGLHAEGGDYIGYQEEGRQEAGEEGEEEVNPSHRRCHRSQAPLKNGASLLTGYHQSAACRQAGLSRLKRGECLTLNL